jgi:predicted transcriptional regulator
MVDTVLKQRVLSALDQLPPTATLEDVIERLVFVAKVEQGLADVDAGRLIPHAQVVAEFRRK